MRQPIKYQARFIVTTRAGRTVATCETIEGAEYAASNGRQRVIWRWFEGRYIAS